MWMFRALFFAMLAFSLVGCGSQQNKTTTPVSPTFTRTVEEITPQPTTSPTPTQVPRPTKNPFTFPFTNPNFATPNPLTRNLEAPTTFPSPNGIWMADAEGLTVRHISGAIVWEIPNRIAGLELWEGNYFSELQWSPDSRYLFFSRNQGFDGGIAFDNATGYWRLDILSGEILEILAVDGDSETYEMKSLGLSQDSTTLAYIPTPLYSDPEERPALELFILDLESGKEVVHQLDYKYHIAGEILWAPNKESLFLLAGYRDDIEDWDLNNIYFEYTLLDVQDGNIEILFETQGNPRTYWPTNWREENLIEFQYNNCAAWYFDLTIGDFVAQATPTPYPTVGESRECNP